MHGDLALAPEGAMEEGLDHRRRVAVLRLIQGLSQPLIERGLLQRADDESHPLRLREQFRRMTCHGQHHFVVA